MKNFNDFINEFYDSNQIVELKWKINQKQIEVRKLFNKEKLTPEYEKAFDELHDLRMELEELKKDNSKGIIRPTK